MCCHDSYTETVKTLLKILGWKWTNKKLTKFPVIGFQVYMLAFNFAAGILSRYFNINVILSNIYNRGSFVSSRHFHWFIFLQVAQFKKLYCNNNIISLCMYHSYFSIIVFYFVFVTWNTNVLSFLGKLKYHWQLWCLFFITGCSCICLLFVFRDEPYHGTGDYNVPYGGVPAHHSAWPHPDVQQMQASQQDARPQRYEMTEYDLLVYYIYLIAKKSTSYYWV